MMGIDLGHVLPMVAYYVLGLMALYFGAQALGFLRDGKEPARPSLWVRTYYAFGAVAIGNGAAIFGGKALYDIWPGSVWMGLSRLGIGVLLLGGALLPVTEFPKRVRGKVVQRVVRIVAMLGGLFNVVLGIGYLAGLI